MGCQPYNGHTYRAGLNLNTKIRERILNEETIVALVTLVAEEIDAMAGELSGRLEVVEAELGDVRKRLEKLYEAIETSELTLEVLSPRIMSLRHREDLSQ